VDAAAGVAGDAVAAAAGAEREDVVMRWSIRTRCVVVVVALLSWLTPSVDAKEQKLATLVPKLDPAWQRLKQSNDQFLTEDQQTLLHDLAFAAAAAGGCPGFTLDRDKFKQGFESLKTDDYMKLPADEKRKREYRLMMNYGAAVALYTAEGLLHPKEGCKFAETKRDQGPGRFWVEPASTPPAR
jgi:hypothetical protein